MPALIDLYTNSANALRSGVGAMFSMLGYALLISGEHAPAFTDEQIIDTLTSLLLNGVAG